MDLVQLEDANNNIATERPGRSVQSLKSRCFEPLLLASLKGFSSAENLQYIPSLLKGKLLKMLTTTQNYCDINPVLYKKVLDALIDSRTHSISLELIDVDDDILQSLCKAKNLQKLILCSTINITATSAGLEALFNKLPMLKSLVLRHCDEMTDEVLSCIAENCPNMIYIDIGGSRCITDRSVSKLNNLRNLRGISVSGTQITDNGIMSIMSTDHSRNIREFIMDQCNNVTNTGITAIMGNCPLIELFSFCNCQKVGDDVPLSMKTRSDNMKNISWTLSL